jgi:uncharacterized membrane protein YqaE (UPF0057 family)
MSGEDDLELELGQIRRTKRWLRLLAYVLAFLLPPAACVFSWTWRSAFVNIGLGLLVAFGSGFVVANERTAGHIVYCVVLVHALFVVWWSEPDRVWRRTLKAHGVDPEITRQGFDETYMTWLSVQNKRQGRDEKR